MRISRVALLGMLAAACGGDATDVSAPADPAKPTTPTTPAATITLGIPEAWSGSTASGAFQVGVTSDRHGGTRAAVIKSVRSGSLPGILSQGIRADDLRGKRVRFSAWVKHENLAGADIGLWMRVDGPGYSLAFDNMQTRSLGGTADWHQISVVLDVPAKALGIQLGALFVGTGTLQLDDLVLETVGNDVRSTDDGSSPTSYGVDSATVASSYARAALAPVNLDFEGIPPTPSGTISWLAQNSSVLSTLVPDAALDDMRPLGSMVGAARLVGLGEGTHGTSEFFKLKHRMLEYLVKEKGFTYFAIEATSPESDDVNRYVLTGEGDPRRLLSHLYFWTWNTQEVLDMIDWMRRWNASAPADKRVQFLGFDMQSPGGSIDSVIAFVDRVDRSRLTFVSDRYRCLDPYRNRQQVGGRPASEYAALPEATRTACAGGLKEVYDFIAGEKARYAGASSETKFENLLHAARLVQQFESMIAAPNTSGSVDARDKAMAENVVWIRDHAPAGAGVVLWAHNGHINAYPRRMGGYLRDRYRADYTTLGFLFGGGSFNAVGANGRLQAWSAEQIRPGSLEEIFVSTAYALALFDARRIAAGGAAAAPLASPVLMRSIGALFDPASETAYFYNALLPADFDLLLYVSRTSASTLLTFVY